MISLADFSETLTPNHISITSTYIIENPFFHGKNLALFYLGACMGILVVITSVTFYLFFQMYIRLMIQAVRRNYDGTPRSGMSRRASFATIDRLFLDKKLV